MEDMKAKSGDLVEVTWEDGTTGQYRVDVVMTSGIVPEAYGALSVPWDRVRLAALNTDLTLAEAHAVYALIHDHLPLNFTTDQKAALQEVLNKVMRGAMAFEEKA